MTHLKKEKFINQTLNLNRFIIRAIVSDTEYLIGYYENFISFTNKSWNRLCSMILVSKEDIQDFDQLSRLLNKLVFEADIFSNLNIIRLIVHTSGQCSTLYLFPLLIIRRKKFLVLHQTHKINEILYLYDTFDTFLSELGKHTRRNIRNVLKKAKVDDLSHVVISANHTNASEIFNLGTHAYPVIFNNYKITELLKLASRHPNGFYSILRNSLGVMISCCVGYIDNDQAFIIFQLNNCNYLKHNPCLTNRAFLIQYLIHQKIDKLVFIDGCVGVLANALNTHQYEEIFIVKFSFRGIVNVFEILSKNLIKNIYQLTNYLRLLKFFFRSLLVKTITN